MSRKLLPITEKSQVYSFTYYSYLQAIIGNNYRIGNIAVVFHVADLNMSEWKLYSKKLTLDTVGKNIVLKTNRFNIGMNGMFYRELSSHDEVDVTILYQQYSRPWGNISLFVTDDDPEQENCRFNYKLGYFNCGEYYKKEKGTQEYLGSTNKNQNRFILKRDETKVYFIIRDFPSGEDIYTQEIMISDVSENSKWKAGIHIELEDNIYYYWFFSNYVQLKWKECELSLEFDLAVRRNWEYYTDNYFINYNIETMKTLRTLNINVVEYMKAKVDNNTYLEMRMDDFNLVSHARYRKKHHKHQCLIYGYDDKEQLIYVLCTNKRIPCKTTITYQDFEEELNRCDDKFKIVSETYDPDPFEYPLSPDNICDSLEKYLNGISVINTGIITPISNEQFGIGIYKYMRSEVGLNYFLHDVRVCHLLCEHKQCMVLRIEYLVEKEIFSMAQVKEELELAQNLQDLAFRMKALVLRYRFTQESSIEDKISTYLEEMETKEKVLIMNLVNRLKALKDD